jgi:hypothetical protein
MGLFVPLLGNDPRPYHWIPLLFHLANTFLFFHLARRILPGFLAALFAAMFWGLHSVAGWITYDISYISDFLATFLLLSGLHLAVRGAARGSPFRASWALVPFALALLTKESATTFPLALWICLGLAELRGSEGHAVPRDYWLAFRKQVPIVAASLALSAALAWLLMYWLRAGLVYAQGPGAAYDINFWFNPAAKLRYLFWALNLPDALKIPSAAPVRAAAFAGMGILLAVCAIDVIRRRGKLSPSEWGGILWFAGLSLPALLLSHRLARWVAASRVRAIGFFPGGSVWPFRRCWFSRWFRCSSPQQRKRGVSLQIPMLPMFQMC